MSTWRKVAVITVVGVALPVLAASDERPLQPEGNSLQVMRDMVTTGVIEREPANDGADFSASMGPVYYFTEVTGASTSTHITHIWYYGGREMAQVQLAVGGPRWRTWSSKQILQEWTGSWTVEAVDPDGNLLSSKTFEVN